MTTTKTMNAEQTAAALQLAMEAGWTKGVAIPLDRGERAEWCMPGRSGVASFTSEEVALRFVRPSIGLPCTIVLGSDRYPAEVVDVTKSTIRVKDEHGEITRYWRVRKWEREVYASKTRTIRLGRAESYLDPSF